MKRNNILKKRILCIVIAISLSAMSFQISVHAQELGLYARSALLMDASNGRVLYEENGYKVMPMASTTKIMTCILAIEWMTEKNGREKERVSVSGYASKMPKVKLGMKEGEEYYFKDLLYSLMLQSHNDTAVAIAEHIDGSVEKFAKRMNEKAIEIGCENTNFITPNGLDAMEKGRAHSTTAYDMALITAYAIQNDEFCNVIQTRTYSFHEQKSKRAFQISNTNRFLDTMEGAIGVKTGFTADAGYCFVGALEKDGKKLISVVLACGWPPNKNWKWKDTEILMNHGLINYQSKDLEKKVKYKPIAVKNGVVNQVNLCVEEKEKGELCLLLSKEDETAVKVEIKEEITAPVNAGEVVGYESYFVNNELYKRYEIKTAESVELRTYFYCLYKIFMLYF